MKSSKRRPKRIKPSSKKKQGRQIPLSEEMVTMLEQQRESFRLKFGREPGQQDPVFFDPDMDTPRPLDIDKSDEELLTAMKAAGIAPELIHAWQRTGRLVTEENHYLLSAKDVAEWQAAIEEYRQLQRTGKFN